MTENDKYTPTPAEKKLLEVLLNAENVGKSVQELCNLAGVSRNKYYDAMKKQEFVDLVNKTTMALIKGKAANVLNAAYNFALTEKGHQDRKMLLTIAGIYTDKQETEISGHIRTDKLDSILTQLSDDDG
ncbi:MAG: phBC6A51 family helix-turn-helix protein [Enterococcus gallinarum]